jgi:hypothetical protein
LNVIWLAEAQEKLRMIQKINGCEKSAAAQAITNTNQEHKHANAEHRT